MRYIYLLIAVCLMNACTQKVSDKKLIGKWIVTDYNTQHFNEKAEIIKIERSLLIGKIFDIQKDNTVSTYNNKNELSQNVPWGFNSETNEIIITYSKDLNQHFSIQNYQDTLMIWTNYVNQNSSFSLTLEKVKE